MEELRDLKDLTIHDVQPVRETGLAMKQIERRIAVHKGVYNTCLAIPDSATKYRWKSPSYPRPLSADSSSLHGYVAYKKTHSLGPYRSPMPRILGGS